MRYQNQRLHRVLLPGLLLILAFSLVLSACSDDASGDNDTEEQASAPASTGSDDMSMGGESDVDAFKVQSEERAESEPSSSQGYTTSAGFERLVIRSANITLTVEDTLGATASVRNIATARSGFVFSSTTYIQDERQYAQLTLRVPADQFDETISELRSAPWVTEVTSEESSSQDVSAEFVDNESRLAALEETQRRYMALLADADTIDSILRLESELTSVRSQIETIKGRQNYLAEMTQFSTITVTLRPAGESEQEEPDDEFSIARIFESAWNRSTGALEGIAEVLVVLAIFAGFFAPLALIAYAFYRFGRRLLNRQRASATTTPRAD